MWAHGNGQQEVRETKEKRMKGRKAVLQKSAKYRRKSRNGESAQEDVAFDPESTSPASPSSMDSQITKNIEEQEPHLRENYACATKSPIEGTSIELAQDNTYGYRKWEEAHTDSTCPVICLVHAIRKKADASKAQLPPSIGARSASFSLCRSRSSLACIFCCSRCCLAPSFFAFRSFASRFTASHSR
jgi:hypothetical protein